MSNVRAGHSSSRCEEKSCRPSAVVQCEQKSCSPASSTAQPWFGFALGLGFGLGFGFGFRVRVRVKG